MPIFVKWYRKNLQSKLFAAEMTNLQIFGRIEMWTGYLCYFQNLVEKFEEEGMTCF